MKGKTIFGIAITATAISVLIAAIMVVLMKSCDDYVDGGND